MEDLSNSKLKRAFLEEDEQNDFIQCKKVNIKR